MSTFSLDDAIRMHKIVKKKQEELKRYELEYDYLLKQLDEFGVKDIQEAKSFCRQLQVREEQISKQMMELWSSLKDEYPDLFFDIEGEKWKS